jgi:hypothetical protein
LGDLVDLGLGEAPTALGLGFALAEEVFWGLGAFAGLGGLLVPLGLGGLGAWEEVLVGLELGGSWALGISPPVWESFAGVSSSMSCGTLHQKQS